jgi:hypothetical protein
MLVPCKRHAYMMLSVLASSATMFILFLEGDVQRQTFALRVTG